MKFSIYAGPPLVAALAATRDDQPDGNRSGRINAICARYGAVVADELRRLDLTRDEWCAVMDALNGHWSDEHSLPHIAAEVADAVGLGEKWEIDQAALTRRLHALPLSAKAAIIEAAARFWARADTPTDQALIAAGVTVR
jgi:hypothetical protein